MASQRAIFTASQVKLHRMIGAAKRPRRLPRPGSTRSLEREYTRILLAIVAKTELALAQLIREAPLLAESARRERRIDGVIYGGKRFDVGEGKRARDLVDAARAVLTESLNINELDAVASQFAVKTATFQRIQLKKQVRAALGVDIFAGDPIGPFGMSLQTMMDGFVSENVALIKDIPAKILSDTEKLVTRSVSSGKLPRDLTKDIRKILKVGKARAKLIARDQIGKFYGQVTASRHMAMGVRKFIWRTANDDRVRDEHVEREGGTFFYDNPPSDGLPGEPINCRCFAEPVFSEILEEAA